MLSAYFVTRDSASLSLLGFGFIAGGAFTKGSLPGLKFSLFELYIILFRASIVRRGLRLMFSLIAAISNEVFFRTTFERGRRSRYTELTRVVRGLPYEPRVVFLRL